MTRSCLHPRTRRHFPNTLRLATALTSFIEDEFDGQGVTVTKSETDCGTQAFEVTANNGQVSKLIHSKLTMGHGKCQSDEELDNILEEVKAMM